MNLGRRSVVKPGKIKLQRGTYSSTFFLSLRNRSYKMRPDKRYSYFVVHEQVGQVDDGLRSDVVEHLQGRGHRTRVHFEEIHVIYPGGQRGEEHGETTIRQPTTKRYRSGSLPLDSEGCA